MSGLKQLRSRIKSIKSTQKITKAMQVVAASKLKKVKDQAGHFDDYSHVLANIMNDITLNLNFMELDPRELKFFNKNFTNLPRLLVVMTSERGLCGSFNSQVLRAVKRDIAMFKAQDIPVRLIVIGKKGHDSLKGEYLSLIEEYYNIVKENSLAITFRLKDKIINLIEQEKIGTCYLYYNEFKNAITQVMKKISILPIDQQELSLQADKVGSLKSQYEYEGQNIVKTLINLYIIGTIKYAFLQSKASEEAARMTAMDNATRNAGDLINELTFKLNITRQARITTELTEIISGAESI